MMVGDGLSGIGVLYILLCMLGGQASLLQIIRHGLIGPGVYASHGYERSHIDGVYNTLKLLCGYLDV